MPENIDKQEVITLYDKNGNTTEDQNETVLAKKIIGVTGEETYKIAFYRSQLYNPGGADSTRERLVRENFQYKKASKEMFDKYLEFLSTRSMNTYSLINRTVLNNG